MAREIGNPYAGVAKIIRRYWRAYGGAHAFFSSPYLHAAILLTVVLYPYWTEQPWWNLSLSVTPILLSATFIGAIFLLTSLGSNHFLEAVLQQGTESSPSLYMQVSATYTHFVVVQAVTLLGALIVQAISRIFAPEGWSSTILFLIGSGLGFGLFLYSILTVVAAALGVFRLASWRDMIANSENPQETD